MQPARRETPTQKRPTNVSLSDPVIAEARALGINLSQAAESGISQAIKNKKAELWLIENKHAIDNANEYVRKNGLPLAKFWRF